MLTEGEDIADALFVNGPSWNLLLSPDLLLKVLKDCGCVNLVVCPCIVVCGGLRAGWEERGQPATTAVSLKTLSKLLFRLPALQTR